MVKYKYLLEFVEFQLEPVHVLTQVFVALKHKSNTTVTPDRRSQNVCLNLEQEILFTSFLNFTKQLGLLLCAK